MILAGLAFGELKMLRIRDVNLEEKEIYIWFKPKDNRRSQKKPRRRVIPIEGAVLESVAWLLARAKRIREKQNEAITPNDFLLPHRAGHGEGWFDFSRPMGSIKRVWYKLCGQAKVKYRQYDCRVSGETAALSDPSIPLPLTTKYFGQIGKKTVERYFKPQKEALRAITRRLQAG